MSNGSPPLDQVVTAMLGRLDDYLPLPSLPLPVPSVSVASVRERAVGLGNHRGMETRGSFAVVELKGIRLDALARFQLWASGPTEADTAITDLNTRLMADRDNLQVQGFLRIALEATSLADLVPPPISAWRKHADYRVLYEYPYTDTDGGAESLIARIPVGIDNEFGEATTVTDEMVRWDNQDAAALVVRGRLSVGRLSALAFVSGLAPSGTVTLTRTFDGAAGAPTTHATLAAFLAAVAALNAPERHAQVTFASVSDFLAAFSAAGDPVTLGDWDLDGAPDSYQPRTLTLEPAIRLPGAADRLEITYQGAAFDQVAVVYLRATRRPKN
ncbi:MAG: hypothetical protein C3F12_08690 [Candidatus Methylomirabilota bacterium]|nr:hypothetical protein [candidate division NC10 bacterium]PWB46123.1 MAG: hypothetical protein C3F12_08690 [candidate division NC10 bacterium]